MRRYAPNRDLIGKTHIPQVKGFWEKFYFRPGNTGYPIFDTAAGRIGVYICYDRHFPEGWRALGLAGARIVFNPSATSRGLSQYLWRLEQPAAAVANEYFVGAINRVGIEDLGDDDFYGTSYFVDPEGKFVGEPADDHKPELVVRDLDMDLIKTVRDRWQFYRDRRPDAYDDLVAADLAEARSRYAKGAKYVRNAAISPSGARAVFEFRGEIVTVPAALAEAVRAVLTSTARSTANKITRRICRASNLGPADDVAAAGGGHSVEEAVAARKHEARLDRQAVDVGVVAGRVLDATTSEPRQGTSVAIVGTRRGAIADAHSVGRP
jgi:hypothetical protein